nr:class I tRNA ligase family protein [Clostridium tagluense]
MKFSKHLYFQLSKFEGEIRKHLKSSKENWRINVVNNTERYLNEGLKDRAISRDLSLGIDIPIKGYEDKIIFI